MNTMSLLLLALSSLVAVSHGQATPTPASFEPGSCDGVREKCCDNDPTFEADFTKCFKMVNEFPSSAELRAACTKTDGCQVCVQEGVTFCGPQRTEQTACSERTNDFITKYSNTCTTVEVEHAPAPCDGVAKGVCCDRRVDFAAAAETCYDLYLDGGQTEAQFATACSKKGKCVACKVANYFVYSVVCLIICCCLIVRQPQNTSFVFFLVYVFVFP